MASGKKVIIDILTIIINFTYPLVLALFLAAAFLLFCSFLKCFFVLNIIIRIRNRNGDFYFARRAPKLRYYLMLYTHSIVNQQ